MRARPWRKSSANPDVVIPFLKRTKSKKLIFDCTTVYHNDEVYDELKEAGIHVYPSAGRPFDVKGGYPPNSHDCMSNELINNRLKEVSRKEFDKVQKSRWNMKSLQTVVNKEAKKFSLEYNRARIGDMPKILATIEQNEGCWTKYWVCCELWNIVSEVDFPLSIFDFFFSVPFFWTETFMMIYMWYWPKNFMRALGTHQKRKF